MTRHLEHDAPPRRLDDDPATGDALRSELERFELADSSYDLDRGLARFESSIAASGPGGPATTRVPTTGLVATAIGVALVGGVWWYAAPPPSPGSHDDAATAHPLHGVVEEARPDRRGGNEDDEDDEDGEDDEERRPVPTREPASPTLSDPPVIDDELPVEANSPRIRSPRARPPKAAAGPEAMGDQVRDEIKHTNRIRRSLGSDPERTLALVDEGDREFGGGMFERERKAYRALALAALGRDAEAHEIAAAYLKAYPKGPLSDQVRKATAPARGTEPGQPRP